jgi:hypothetical protein
MKAADVRRAALALPGVVEAPHFKAASFRVGGKIFATLMPEGDVLNVFVAEEQRETALALHPEAVEKLFWGNKAVGLTIFLAKTDQAMLSGLLQQAWHCKAPRSVLGPEAES